jgi:hypothetical protein
VPIPRGQCPQKFFYNKIIVGEKIRSKCMDSLSLDLGLESYHPHTLIARAMQKNFGSPNAVIFYGKMLLVGLDKLNRFLLL